jgi:hypothetical protein
VSPAAFTAGKGTQPLKTLRNGLYFSMRVPAMPDGTVWGKPTTAVWAITARLSRLMGEARTREAAARSWTGRLRRLNILTLLVLGIERSGER